MTPPPPHLSKLLMNLIFYDRLEWIQKVFWSAPPCGLFGKTFLVQIKAPPFEND